MKKLTRLLTTTALTLALASPALAQSTTGAPAAGQQPPAATTDDSSSPATGATGATAGERDSAATFPMTEQESEHMMAGELIGTPVVGPEGDQIGEISDLVLDESQGVVGAVVSVGGFLGIGSKKVGVPWESVQVQTLEGRTVASVDLSQEQLTDAEPFKTRRDLEKEAEAARMQSSAPSTGAAPSAPTR